MSRAYRAYLNMLIELRDQPDFEKLSEDLMKKAHFDMAVSAGEFYSLARTRIDMILQKERSNGEEVRKET